jgi:hypothetical protein
MFKTSCMTSPQFSSRFCSFVAAYTAPAANERHTPITRDRFIAHLNKQNCFANVELRPHPWMDESPWLAKLKSDSV